jgi:hypothetical protein
LQHLPHARSEPLFDPESFWRVPDSINTVAIPLPVRKITNIDVAVLNARRAGNRGKAKRQKTTPVLA